MKQMTRQLSILFLIVSAGLTVFAQMPPSPQMIAANELFKAQKWMEAKAAFENIVKSEPDNGGAWSRLAATRRYLNQFAPAAEAYRKSIAISNSGFEMLYLASVYSLMGEKDKAIEWLTKSSENPKMLLQMIDSSDPDFANIKDDARFKNLINKIDRKTHPCVYSDEAKQFNFFVGEWDAYNPQGRHDGTSVIQSISNGCGVLENWRDTFGGEGKSINFYDASTGIWYQYWMGQNGVPSRYSGIYRDGALRYEGEPTIVNGKKTLNRLTFFKLDENTVRQLFESSDDEGKTWTTGYDLKYVRKNAKQ
ncbi:MAG: hypothetical protein ABI891_13465 [Acidobacteriota bacterium]